MPNTKITPISRAICPLCKEEVTAGERFELHVTQCAMNPKRHTCYECGKDFKERVYLKRHVKLTGHTQAPSVESAQTPKTPGDDTVASNSSWDSDPEVEVAGEPCIDFNIGRVIRKRTVPELVRAPKKPRISTESQSCSTWIEDRPAAEAVASNDDSTTKDLPTVVCTAVQTDDRGMDVHRCSVCDITFGNQAMLFVHKGCHCVDNPL
ncbi:uncharacterized protein LOC127879265 [Dreissena polymorpha]|nr:uncharacterized protein LOC127879265 [Dreissena polymorpha]